ncbi:kinesin-like protein KIF20B isoform X2 [Hydra vulgaris]|uniref:kinesin-like protein KIF20B isoform X2 n=1 Tax=Hydra vulgaris TaxID=6087 RepID=UPI0032EA3F02
MDNIAVKLFPSVLSDADKEKEPMKVFLRIRPFIKAELSQNENQGCILIKDDTNIELLPPQNSFMYKSGMRLASDQSHEYSFTHVFKETTKQKEFFDKTMLPFVEDLLDGQNGLVFTYGVTNSGKTYTIQGVPEDGGILPRSLDVIFNSIKKQRYIRANIKPKFCNEVTYLTEEEEIQEDLIKKSVLNAVEHNDTSKFMNSTSRSATCSSLMSDISVIQKSDSNIDILSVIDEEIRQRIADNTTVNLENHGKNIQYSIWISFMEIYNELMYDLFDPSSIVKGKKRTALKLGDDKNGNPYVKDLREVCVNSSDEAYKLLRLGQQNRRMAATKLNQSSSRSHSIFSIKLLKIVDEQVSRMSRISIVDLAGSERYCKTQAASDRLKEASNINSSIMTLGQCISALRYNQIHPKCQTIIPFRESKLTRLFQSFFLGKGKAAMIVNISQCASVFDETSNVMKFSAVAKQVKLKAQRATEIWKVPPIPKTPVATKSYPKICIVTPATSSKRTLNDPTAFSYDELVQIVAELRDKLKKERKEKDEIESKLRAEICGEMNEVMDEMEKDYKNQLQEQRERLEDLMEKRLDLLTNLAETLHKNEQREKQDGDGYVSAVLFQAEVLKLKDRDDTICQLKAKIDELESDKNHNKQLSPLPLSGLYESLKRDFEEAKETLAVQTEAMNRMQEQLMYKDDEIEKLVEALGDNSQDSIEVSKLEEVQNLLAETTRELEITKGQLQEQEQKLQKLVQLEEDHKELLKVASNHEEWYELIKQKNVFLTEEKDEIQRKYSELDEKYKSTLKELEHTAKNYQESVEAFQTAQFENEENCLKIEKLESVTSEYQESFKAKDSIIKELNEKLYELKEKISFYEEKDCKENINTQEIESLLTSKENLEIKIKDYEVKIEELEKKLSSYENNCSMKPEKDTLLHEGNMTPSKPVIKSLHTQKKFDNFSSPLSPMMKVKQVEIIQNLEKRLADTTKALEKKTASLVCKNNKIQQLEKECSKELLVEHDKIKKENAEMHTKLDELNKEYTNLILSNELLKKSCTDFEYNATSLHQELIELKTNLKSAEEELLVVQNKYAKSVEYCQSIEAELLNVKEGLLIIQDKLKNCEMDSAENNEKSIMLNEKLLNSESLLKSKEREVMNLQEINEETKRLVKNHEFQKTVYEENELKLRKDLEDQRNFQTALEDKFKVMFQELKESKVELINDRDKAWIEVDKLEAENQALDQLSLTKNEIQNLKAELEKLAKFEGNISLEPNCETIVDTLPLQVQKLEANKIKLIKKITKLEEDLLKQETVISALRFEINDLNIQIVEMSDKCSNAEDKLFVKNKTLSKLEAENQLHLQKIMVLEENISMLEKKKGLVELKEEKIALLQAEQISELNTEKISLLEGRKVTNKEKLSVLDENILVLEEEKSINKTKVSAKKPRSKQKRISVTNENTITSKKSKITPQKPYPSRKVLNCIQNNECETLPVCNESLVASVSIALSPLQTDSHNENNLCSHINIGEFVALKTGSVSEPSIGRVLSKSSNRLMLEIWQESNKKSWSVKSGYNKHEIFVDEVLCGGIYFTNSKKLPISLQRKLQTLYS